MYDIGKVPKRTHRILHHDISCFADAHTESPGAGILDAKKALAECDCDMDKAMEWLKKKGMAKADSWRCRGRVTVFTF